ncbi:MAG: hypothetical protein KC503_38085, partial [Myxococcales bacterium]|nr:hypothetical protein [Myxococcales bacterium]
GGGGGGGGANPLPVPRRGGIGAAAASSGLDALPTAGVSLGESTHISAGTTPVFDDSDSRRTGQHPSSRKKGR